MDPSSLLQGRTRETTIRRDRLGHWSHDGLPITHPQLTRSFDEWVEKAEDGRYCLKNDINWAYITLEGAPVFVRAVEFAAEQDLPLLHLSNGRVEPLRLETLRQGVDDDALYCDVSKSLTARFDTAAAVQMDRLLGEDDRGVYVACSGHKIYPPVVPDPVR